MALIKRGLTGNNSEQKLPQKASIAEPGNDYDAERAPHYPIGQGVISNRTMYAKQIEQMGTRLEHHQSTSDVRSAVSAEKGPTKPFSAPMINGIDAKLYDELVKEIGRPSRRKKKVDVALAS